MNASNTGRGWDLCFFLVASHQGLFVVTATTRRYFFHHLGPVPFGEGTMRRTGSGWDRSFFWQFVNDAHGTADCLKRVVLLASPAPSTHTSPFLWRHSLPPFLLLAGDRTRSGRHYLFRRFSYSSQENTRRKVMGA